VNRGTMVSLTLANSYRLVTESRSQSGCTYPRDVVLLDVVVGDCGSADLTA